MRHGVPGIALVLLLGGVEAAAQERREYVEMHMGMPVRIALHAPAEQGAGAARAAFATIARLEDLMSDYRADSEVRRLGATHATWVPVSPPLFAVLAQALAVAHVTDGAFDPTAGPLVALWRTARRERRLPTRTAIRTALRRTGWRHVALDTVGRRVRLARAGMQLDLGGIAKGWILQAALDTLRARGVPRALLEAGGDIVVGEAPPGEPGWHIETPGADSVVAIQAARLVDAAIATSGPTAQFVEIGGVRYSHVVNPRTGLALVTDELATVIAHHGATADALATALTVVAPARRPAVLARFPGVIVSVHR